MNTQQLKAFIFDLNGTMINDMRYHTQAWHELLNNELNARLSWSEVKKEMYGKNEELLVRVFGANHFSKEEMHQWSEEKERRYRAVFRPHLQLIAGLENFLKTASERGIRLAVGTAAIPSNVDFVLDGLHIRSYFPTIVTATDVAQSKPDPETFLKAARLLNVPPQDCLVFEDAPKGVEAALNAGMQVVVLTTMHDRNEFRSYPNIRAFVADYNDPVLHTLFETVAIIPQQPVSK
jgi:beta-phosphoglucomutase